MGRSVYSPLSVLVVFSAVFCLVTCTETPFPSAAQDPMEELDTVSTYDPQEITPMENEEAELAALWLSGELVAPVELYEQVRHDLFTIRTQWQDSLEAWSDSAFCFYSYYKDSLTGIRFVPPWQTSLIEVRVLAEDAQPFFDQTHEEWALLLKKCQVDSVTVGHVFYPTEQYRFYCYLTNRFNPNLLVEQFGQVQGVDEVWINDLHGSCQKLYLSDSNGRLDYYFYFSGGEYPQGCWGGDVCYFRVEENTAVLIDHFRACDISEGETPDWWMDFVSTLTSWNDGEPPKAQT